MKCKGFESNRKCGTVNILSKLASGEGLERFAKSLAFELSDRRNFGGKPEKENTTG